MRTRAVILLALPALGGCGPTEAEAGQAVLLAAVPITLIGLGLQALYAAAWRRLGQEVRVSVPVIGGIMASIFGVAVLTALRWQRGTDDWIAMAFVAVGFSYLSLLVIALRLGALAGLRRAYPWAPAVPWVLLWPPAVYHAFAGSTTAELGDATEAIWILPGMGGWSTVPLLLAFGIEITVRLVRDARRRAAAAPVEPEFPTARIHRE